MAAKQRLTKGRMKARQRKMHLVARWKHLMLLLQFNINTLSHLIILFFGPRLLELPTSVGTACPSPPQHTLASLRWNFYHDWPSLFGSRISFYLIELITGKVDQEEAELPHLNPQDTVWILPIGQYFHQGGTKVESTAFKRYSASEHICDPIWALCCHNLCPFPRHQQRSICSTI